MSTAFENFVLRPLCPVRSGLHYNSSVFPIYSQNECLCCFSSHFIQKRKSKFFILHKNADIPFTDRCLTEYSYFSSKANKGQSL